MFKAQSVKRSMETSMSSKQERIDERVKRIREEEEVSHGRNPENLDPEMLDEEDAETVRANKAIRRHDQDRPVDEQPLKPGERLPPD